MRKFLKITALVLLLLAVAAGGFAYWQAWKDNVNPKLKEGFALYIPKGSTYEDVIRSLEEQQVLQSVSSFKLIAGIRKYDRLVKPGRYEIKRGLNNWKLVEKLRAGAQDQMKLRIGSHRTIMEVAGEIAQQVDLDTASLLGKMRDKAYLEEYGVDPKTIRNILIPNTYFVYWTLSEDDLFRKLKNNFDLFWTADRKAKAATQELSIHEVMTLASIVQSETYMTQERPTVAGLYLNRLHNNIPLQADPTLIYAAGDFTIKRVLNEHKLIDSPYNTYMYAGLPPGPINNPELSAIEAVLNPEKHDYIFMCAKADFSGFHNFSRTLAQHNQYAREYQAAMNKKKVYR
ncbi:MAG: endolytic transglycosylase MltG [Bacteroidetes bacterium]|nr:endolytic transglycosylase MltG [Bacteroidota bacterium]